MVKVFISRWRPATFIGIRPKRRKKEKKKKGKRSLDLRGSNVEIKPCKKRSVRRGTVPAASALRRIYRASKRKERPMPKCVGKRPGEPNYRHEKRLTFGAARTRCVTATGCMNSKQGQYSSREGGEEKSRKRVRLKLFGTASLPLEALLLSKGKTPGRYTLPRRILKIC